MNIIHTLETNEDLSALGSIVKKKEPLPLMEKMTGSNLSELFFVWYHQKRKQNIQWVPRTFGIFSNKKEKKAF